MALLKPVLLATLMVVLLGGFVRAAELPPLKIKTCISARGMSPKVVKATRRKIVMELKSLGAEVTARQDDSAVEDSCCNTPECLGEEAKKRKVDGVVDVHVLRFGPMVRITIRIFDTAGRNEIRKTRAKASARNFPASASLKDVFGKGLKTLRTLIDKRKALAESAKRASTAYSGAPKVSHAKESDAGSGPEAVVIIEQKVPEKPSSLWHWIGGGLTGGGAILAATGIYYLVGPMPEALDRRDAALRGWAAAEDQRVIEEYESEIHKQDDRAREAHLLGWVTTGIGTAMVVGGILAIILAPDSTPGGQLATESGRPNLRPLAFREGGGLVLEWNW